MVVIFMVLCAVGFSLFDASRKKLLQNFDALPLLLLLCLGQVVLFGAWAIQRGAPLPASAFLLPALGSIAVNLVGQNLFLFAVRASPLSLVIPMLSLSPVAAFFIGVFMFGETLQPVKLSGSVLVILGALYLGAGSLPKGQRHLFLKMLFKEKGVPIMMCVAAFFAAASSFDKAAVAHCDVALYGAIQNAGVGVFALIVMAPKLFKNQDPGFTARNAFALKKHFLLYVGSLVVACCALAFQLLAFEMTSAGIVETVKRALGMTMSIFLGRLFFSEHMTMHKFVAVVMMGGGVGFVLLT